MGPLPGPASTVDDDRPDTDAGRFARLLHPQSIAVVGGGPAAEAIRQCRRMGFAGSLWPVHPRHDSIEGLPAFRGIPDLPVPPDAAFVAVNRDTTLNVVAELAAAGCGGAVCYASGFSESADGGSRQADLVAAAADMPILGPNCYGLINYLDGALLWPDVHGGRRRERGVAILTQSGNIAINLTMTTGGLPIAYVAAMGNQAQTGIAHLLRPMVDDPRVTAIGLLLEGIGDLAAFDAAARLALAAGKPIVALKFGRSEAGAQLALSHTASLAGGERAMDALFDRWGIARVRSLPAFVETLKLLHAFGPLPGADIATLSCSGGEAAILADSAAGRSGPGAVRFRSFTPDQAATVKATVDPLVTVSNPFDYHTFMWGDPDRQARTFAAVMTAGFAVTALVLDFPRPDQWEAPDWRKSADALLTATQETGARAALVSGLPGGLPESVAEAMMGEGVPCIAGFDDFFTAIESAAAIGSAQRTAPPAPLLPVSGLHSDARHLDEAASKRLLHEYGLSVPDGQECLTADEAAAAADRLGYPVAVKLLSASVTHKSDIGGVALNLADAAAVRAAATRILDLPESNGRVLVESMVGDAVGELIIGVDRDPVAGPVLVVGAGGVLVELLDDSAVLTLPTSETAVRTALLSLRCIRLLQGWRGRPPGDINAAIAAVLAVAGFAVDRVDSLAELDINPLMVRPSGLGVVAADALVALASPARAPCSPTNDDGPSP